jgi:predicted nuclease of predicted toxin-antitoxin system
VLRYIVDTQLPPRLAAFLREQHFDAVHTTDFPEGHLLQDTEIRAIARAEDRIIITKDTDFFDYYMVKGSPPMVLLLKVGNISNADLLALVASNLALIVSNFENSFALIVLSPTHFTAY